jgi:hypothetical protein
MKLFDFHTHDDFGRDFYLILGQFKRFNVFELEVHTSSYKDWEPNFNLDLGVLCGSVVSFGVSIWSVSLAVSFINYRFPMDISYWKGQ